MVTKPVYHAAVVGAGVVGLAAAWNFRRLGPDRVVVLERFQRGHARGSSHGSARITRSAYSDPIYVRLLQAAYASDWPRLEAEAGERLRYFSPTCFFGRGPLYRAYAETMRAFPDEAEIVTPQDAQRRFPALRFQDAEGAIVDHTGGVVAAGRTMAALERLCIREGVEIRENSRALALEPEAGAVRVRTEGGDVLAKHVLVAAGAWIPELIPRLSPRLRVIRQTVGYFRLQGPPEAMDLGRFPIWGYLGEGPEEFFYGLPRFESEGVKLARHVTSERTDDPQASEPPRGEALEELTRFAALRFRAPAGNPVAAETCLYTCTATEDFVIDRHPEDARIAIASACSGHGFKFAPLTGRILAELALLGKTGVPEFEANRSVFAL